MTRLALQPVVSGSAPSPIPMQDFVRQAAGEIDPCTYREVSLALVAADASLGQVTNLALAIAEAKGEQCQREFLASTTRCSGRSSATPYREELASDDPT